MTCEGGPTATLETLGRGLVHIYPELIDRFEDISSAGRSYGSM